MPTGVKKDYSSVVRTAAAIERLHEIRKEMKALEKEQDDLKTKHILPLGIGNYTTGNVDLSISEGERSGYSADRLRKLVPRDTLRKCERRTHYRIVKTDDAGTVRGNRRVRKMPRQEVWKILEG